MEHHRDGPTLYTNGTSQRRSYIVQECRTVAAAMDLLPTYPLPMAATVLQFLYPQYVGPLLP